MSYRANTKIALPCDATVITRMHSTTYLEKVPDKSEPFRVMLCAIGERRVERGRACEYVGERQLSETRVGGRRSKPRTRMVLCGFLAYMTSKLVKARIIVTVATIECSSYHCTIYGRGGV